MYTIIIRPLLILPVLLLCLSTLRAQPSLSTADAQVYTTTANDQTWSAAARAGDGQSLVFWEKIEQGGDGQGIFAQLSGAALHRDSLDLLPAWQDDLHKSSGTQGGDGHGIFAKSSAVNDVTPPNAVCQNITIFLDGSGAATITAADVDGGSTDNVGITSSTIDLSSFNCANLGANSVTLAVADSAGNTDTCSATVTVQDTTSPTAVCANVTIFLNGAGNASTTAASLDGGSTDNCAVSSTTASQTSFTCADVGNNSVSLTVSDASSNTGTCTATVAVQDTSSPTAICQNITVFLNGSGTANIAATDLLAIGSDNCSISSTTVSQSAFTCADLGPNNVTLTATDPSGNSRSCSATVRIEDNINPSAVCQNVTVQLNASGTASTTASAVNNGSSDNCSISTSSLDQSSFTCADVGANTVVLTVSDASGNSDDCAATVTVQDQIAPTAICKNLTFFLNASGTISITPAVVDNGSTDNCSPVTLALSTTTFTCSDLGANSETLTVTDPNGNSSTCTSNILILDSIAPTVACNDLTLFLDGSGSATLTTAQVDNGSSDNCSIASSSLSTSAFDCGDAGTTTTVTLIQSDASSNSSACNAAVTVIDNTPPAMSCQNITVSLDASGSASITAASVDGGTSDNCSVSSLTISNSNFECADIGANTVVLTAVDPSGLSSSCNATVTVEDNAVPSAVCRNVTIYLDANGNATTSSAALDNGSSDNCSVASLGISISTFSCASLGTNNVLLTAADGSGNTGTCISLVTVLDSIAPTAVCTNTTVNLDANGQYNYQLADAEGGSTDNCSIAGTSFSPGLLECADLGGTFNFPLTVTDASGNSASCTATVTVADATAPNMVCQNATIFVDAVGDASVSATAIDGGSTDNCNVNSVSLDIADFDCGDLGANTVTLTGVDDSGNSSSCTAQVTVIDTIPPSIVCQNSTVYLDANGNVSVGSSDVLSSSLDNCAISSVVLSPSVFSCSSVGASSVFVSVLDASGNFNFCNSTITVLDTISPTAACNDITAYLDASGSVTVTLADVDGGSSDNCAVSSTVFSPVTYGCADVGGPYALTLSVADASGNADACLASVIVEDSTPPVAACQNLTVFLDNTGNYTLPPSDVSNTTDNCSFAESLSQSAFDCSDIGTVTVSYTATDPGGLTATCTAIVSIADSASPAMVCQDITVTLDASGNTSIATGDIDNGSADNCTSVNLFLVPSSLSCADVGNATVSLFGQDGFGNINFCNSVVTVQDTFAPTALCQPFTVSLGANGTAFSNGSPGDAGSTDNCGIDTTSLSISTFSCADIGTVNTTLQVFDLAGNADSCAVAITVLDAAGPNALCASPTLYLNASGSLTVSPADLDAGSTDNCGIASTSLSATSFGCADIGNQSITLTVTDNAGNSSSCTSNVTIADSTAPVAICQAATVTLNGSGTGSLTAADVDGGSTDNCGIASLAVNTNSFTCTDVGTASVTLTLSDNSGNTNTCIAQVNVVDATPPLAVCTGTTVTLDGTGNGTLLPSQIDFGSSDNCSVDSLVLSKDSFDCNDLGVNSLTLTVFDPSGNSQTCAASVFVEDTDAPVAVCANPTVYLNATGTANVTGADLDGGSTDNCGVDSLSFAPASFSCADAGSQSVTLTAFDGSGNSGSCTSTVTVADTTSPIVICRPDTVYLDLTGTATVAPADIDGGSTDNCGLQSGSGSVSPSSFTVADLGPNTVTLSYTDVNGNPGSCQATVTVLDSLADAIGDENFWAGSFDLWPNPTPGLFQVELKGVEGLRGEDVAFELTDMSGKVLLVQHAKYGAQGIRQEFDLGSYAQGSYVLRVKVDGKLLTRKLIKY